MTTKRTAQTIYENADGKRVWVFWLEDKPEFVPGYWDLDNDGIENMPANEWCIKMNQFVDALKQIGCSYQNIETTIRYTMVDGLGFQIVEDYDPKYAA